MQIFGKTDIGAARHSNQDTFFIENLSDDTILAIVCDGMGGAKAGNIASENAVTMISDYVFKSYSPKMNAFAISDLLKNAVVSANIEIYQLAAKNDMLKGMGTTVVAALIRGNDVVVCHVGDSRAYVMNDELSQITRDHSVVQSLVESGKLTPEEAMVHPEKNVITKALGVEADIMPDCCEFTIRDNDKILLCTDGLTNFVEPKDISQILKNNNVQDAAVALIDKANSNGGGDNITVVVAFN